jgi:hypothetical protein
MDEQANKCCKRDHSNGFNHGSALEPQWSLDDFHGRSSILRALPAFEKMLDATTAPNVGTNIFAKLSGSGSLSL